MLAPGLYPPSLTSNCQIHIMTNGLFSRSLMLNVNVTQSSDALLLLLSISSGKWNSVCKLFFVLLVLVLFLLWRSTNLSSTTTTMDLSRGVYENKKIPTPVHFYIETRVTHCFVKTHLGPQFPMLLHFWIWGCLHSVSPISPTSMQRQMFLDIKESSHCKNS